jgi:hypothetical protein
LMATIEGLVLGCKQAVQMRWFVTKRSVRHRQGGCAEDLCLLDTRAMLYTH